MRSMYSTALFDWTCEGKYISNENEVNCFYFIPLYVFLTLSIFLSFFLRFVSLFTTVFLGFVSFIISFFVWIFILYFYIFFFSFAHFFTLVFFAFFHYPLLSLFFAPPLLLNVLTERFFSIFLSRLASFPSFLPSSLPSFLYLFHAPFLSLATRLRSLFQMIFFSLDLSIFSLRE